MTTKRQRVTHLRVSRSVRRDSFAPAAPIEFFTVPHCYEAGRVFHNVPRGTWQMTGHRASVTCKRCRWHMNQKKEQSA